MADADEDDKANVNFTPPSFILHIIAVNYVAFTFYAILLRYII